ncbi:MAG: DUF4352 domain-containing protein, partial [Candidatus Micrarchaeota archaeon]
MGFLKTALKGLAILILIGFILEIFIVASYSATSHPNTTLTNNTPNEKPTQTDALLKKPGDSIDLGSGLLLKITNVRHAYSVKNVILKTASSGAKFIIFDAKYENTGSSSATMSADFRLKDDFGRNYDVTGGYKDDAGRMLDLSLNPGLSRTRLDYYFEVPQNMTKATIIVESGG